MRACDAFVCDWGIGQLVASKLVVVVLCGPGCLFFCLLYLYGEGMGIYYVCYVAIRAYDAPRHHIRTTE